MSFKSFVQEVKNEHYETVRSIFKEGFIHEQINGKTALHYACEFHNETKCVNFLLDNGWYIEAMTNDERKERPVHLAVRNVRVNVLTLLIERGCNLNSCTAIGETPLDLANLVSSKPCKQLIEKALKLEAEESNQELNKEYSFMLNNSEEGIDYTGTKKPLPRVSRTLAASPPSKRILCDKTGIQNNYFMNFPEGQIDYTDTKMKLPHVRRTPAPPPIPRLSLQNLSVNRPVCALRPDTILRPVNAYKCTCTLFNLCDNCKY